MCGYSLHVEQYIGWAFLDSLQPPGECVKTVERGWLLDILSDADLLWAFRFLAGPPISADDLKTLADASGQGDARQRTPAGSCRANDQHARRRA